MPGRSPPTSASPKRTACPTPASPNRRSHVKTGHITPITEMGRRAPEAGRIRLGTSKPPDSGRGKRRPVKLKTFRFTSTQKNLIDELARQYGGTVQPWEDGQWEVISTVDEIEVFLLPD